MKLGKTTKTLLQLAALAVAYLVVCLVDSSTTKPGRKERVFDGFIQSKRPPQKIERIEKEEQQYVFVTGRMTPLWFVTIPSGPPCYVFDSGGTLIDWTKDIGDDSRFVERWPVSLRREVIGADGARELFQKKLSARVGEVSE